MESTDAVRSSAVLPRPAGRTAPLKPWELRGSASAINRPALASQPLSQESIQPPTSTALSSSSTLATTTSPRPPARPWDRSRSDYGALSRYDDNSYGGYGGSSYMNSRDRYGSYGSNSYGGYGNNSYGGYGSSYGSSYGGYGSSGYGSSYGGYGSSSYGSPGYGRDRDYGYGSSYGGYGSSSYGGYGGYNSYGGGFGGMGGYGRGDPFFDKPGPGGILANGFSWMSSVQYVVDTFSRFSRLLDANYDAMHGSFTSVLRLCERMGHLHSEVLMMIKTFTIFRLFQSFSGRFMQVFRYMTGRPMIKDTKTDTAGKGFVRDFHEFSRDQPRAPGWGAMMLVFVVTFVGLPVILHRLIILFARSRRSDQLELQWTQNQQQEKVRALYSFVPETNRDLPFQAGDVLVIVNKGHPDWWEAEANGRVGLIPSNFVQIIEDKNTNNIHNSNNLEKYPRPPDE